jgi:hypothetical protein
MCRDSILAAPLVSGFGAVYGFGAARRNERRSGMAFVLFQSAANRAGTLPGTRYFYSIDEAQKHSAASCRAKI